MALADIDVEVLAFTEFLDPNRSGRQELQLVRGLPFTLAVGSLALPKEVQRETNNGYEANLRLILPNGDLTTFVLDRGEGFNDLNPRTKGGEVSIADWPSPRYLLMSRLGASIRKARGNTTYATNVGSSFAWTGDRVLADLDKNGRFCPMPRPGTQTGLHFDPRGTILQFNQNGSIQITLTHPDQESRSIIVPE